jgi:hypothetical protein
MMQQKFHIALLGIVLASFATTTEQIRGLLQDKISVLGLSISDNTYDICARYLSYGLAALYIMCWVCFFVRQQFKKHKEERDFNRTIEDPISLDWGKKSQSKAAVLENFALDELGVAIVTALEVAETKRQEIGVAGMLELMASLGHDKVITNLGLNALMQNNFIQKSFRMEPFSHYYNLNKAKEYLKQNPMKLLNARNLLPDDYSRYAPDHMRIGPI